ncbi:MAG TPA: diphosphomevalonate decarboxylase [Candidatus Thermoplasmatota archaeon]|nr:diphosphomevalonate decarboxylase [Candidatus Thermoplasmatota archaeon]
MKATAEARANIALIKYWGRIDHELNLPVTSSLSLTVDKLVTRTTVVADPALKADELVLNGVEQGGAPLARVVRHLDRLRERAGSRERCRVVTENTFAASAGMASSASGFAALTVAGFEALGAKVDAREQSTFARLGSGSASRSIFGGFVEWHAGKTHEESYAEPVAPPTHMDLHDVVVVLSEGEKKVGSAEGHGLADTSPLHGGRIARVPELLREVREGIRARDLERLGAAAEEDAILMHAVMMTSRPSLLYWNEGTVRGLHAVREWREEGLKVYATIDAGPNLHLLCMGKDAREVARRAQEELRPTSIIENAPGEGARLVSRHLA